MAVFECSGTVESLERSMIPFVIVMTVSCGCGSIKVSIHDEVLTFIKGEMVYVNIDETLPTFKENDFCGVLYLVKKDGEVTITSVGGFVITFERCSPRLVQGKKYYICIRHTR